MGRVAGETLTRRGWLRAHLAGGLAGVGQEQVFRVEVRLVRLLVTVKDSNGRITGGLEKEDFVIEDSGVLQEIAIFERQTAQPLSIALLVDTSGSTAKELTYEIDSVARFLAAVVREGNPADAMALVSFNHDVTLQSGFTRNPRRIQSALGRLKAEAGTSLYDALYLAADMLANRDGRKVVVALTDGGDTTSARSFHDALRALHGVDAVLYSVVVVPITNEAGRNVGGENALITLSQSTGGRVFFPSIGRDLDQALAEILRDLRTQYLLGYYPRRLPPPPPDRFRTVRVKLSRPELRPSTRAGYYEE